MQLGSRAGVARDSTLQWPIIYVHQVKVTRDWQQEPRIVRVRLVLPLWLNSIDSKVTVHSNTYLRALRL